MSIFDQADTLCVREGNRCKRRMKCARFQSQKRDGHWEAEYYDEFGQFCSYFLEISKATNPSK